MINFIQTEFLKLKNSKIFLLTVIGILFESLFIILSKIEEPTTKYTLEHIFQVNNQYIIAIISVLICCIIISYLIGREYNEHTLKSIITTPISRTKYITGKYIMFFIWFMILLGISFLGTLFTGYILGAEGFTTEIILKGLKELIIGGILTFLVMSPFMFIAMIITNMVPAMIGGVGLILANLMVYGQSKAPYFPWISPYIISSGQINNYSCSIQTSLAIILITFLIGIIISYIYFNKKDIPL